MDRQIDRSTDRHVYIIRLNMKKNGHNVQCTLYREIEEKNAKINVVYIETLVHSRNCQSWMYLYSCMLCQAPRLKESTEKKSSRLFQYIFVYRRASGFCFYYYSMDRVAAAAAPHHTSAGDYVVCSMSMYMRFLFTFKLYSSTVMTLPVFLRS